MDQDELTSDPARPRAVLFDAGLTLIHASGKLLLEEMSADNVDTAGRTPAEATQALVIAAEARHLPLPAGLDGTEKVAASVVRLLGIDHPAAVGACLRALARDDLYQDLDPDAVPTLTALRDAGLRLGVVSNSAGTVRDDLAAFDLLRFFDVVVDSTVVGAEKPHPRPFRLALRELGLSAQACWYVGDGLVNDVLGAYAAGYARGVLLDRFGSVAAVPGIVRVTRLAELVELIDRMVPAPVPGVAAADPGGADRLATSAVRAVSTLADPNRFASRPNAPAQPGRRTPRRSSMDEQRCLDIDALVAAIVRTGRGRPRVLVGIDGQGASGKSTLAGLLAERLDRAVVVHVDDFYLPNTFRGSRAGEVGALFDLPRLAEQVVRPAATGSALRYQRYDWDIDQLADWIEVEAGVPVIVEGVYTLQQRLRESYSYTVFCRATPDVRLRRGLDRDGEQARSMWVDEWMPAEDSYVDAERPDDFADLVVDSSAGVDGAAVNFIVERWED